MTDRDARQAKIDTHIHCDYSGDSVLTYDELCKKAIDCGYTYLAITEHFDLEDSQMADYGVLPLRFYFKECQRIRETYPQLEICTGLELGEPHRTLERAESLFKSYRPEYIIGSLHMLESGLNISLAIKQPFTLADIRQYYEENLAMVECGGFDTLGHLGIYQRGLQEESQVDESCVQNIIDKIFTVMISKEIALEINNSGYKSSLKNHIPSAVLLLRYKQLGGKLLCVGSDSHNLQQFDRFYNKTLDSLRSIGFSSLCIKSKGRWEHMRLSK